MRAILDDGLLVLLPETDPEQAQLQSWRSRHAGHFFVCDAAADAAALVDRGAGGEATEKPLNVVSNSADPIAATIGNFSRAPFVLDGRRYVSVESFWQGLKFFDAADRARIAALDGAAAREAGEARGYGPTVDYEGANIPVGAPAHWDLMARACAAKFEQDAAARAALLATGKRPLVHRTARDSRAIPGAIMAAIWMRLRARLRDAAGATE